MKFPRSSLPRDKLAEIYAREIKKIPVLEPKEKRKLLEEASRGDKFARQALILANLRFAFLEAKRFYSTMLTEVGENLSGAFTFSDLIQEANIGLMKAIEHYDVEKYSVDFLTYAGYWITQRMRRFIQEKGWALTYIPTSLQDLRKKVSWAEWDFRKRMGREPSLSELSAVLEISEQRLYRLKLLTSRKSISLDSFLDSEDDEGMLVEEVIAQSKDDIYNTDLESEILRFKLRYKLKKLLFILTPRERLVLLSTFGFFTPKPLSLVKIGKILGVGRERVRQIRERALKKIRTKLDWQEREEIRQILRQLKEAKY
jgi:RNA polymerase primary sigma factor